MRKIKDSKESNTISPETTNIDHSTYTPMEKLHIADKSESHKRNIFDELAAIADEEK